MQPVPCLPQLRSIHHGQPLGISVHGIAGILPIHLPACLGDDCQHCLQEWSDIASDSQLGGAASRRMATTLPRPPAVAFCGCPEEELQVGVCSMVSYLDREVIRFGILAAKGRSGRLQCRDLGPDNSSL